MVTLITSTGELSSQLASEEECAGLRGWLCDTQHAGRLRCAEQLTSQLASGHTCQLTGFLSPHFCESLSVASRIWLGRILKPLVVSRINQLILLRVVPCCILINGIFICESYVSGTLNYKMSVRSIQEA